MNKLQITFKDETQNVERAVIRAENRVLNKIGYVTMSDARRSIRPGRKVSQPGKPPRSKLGTLKRGIRYAVDKEQKLVVMGPEYLPRKSKDAPQALEHGGVSVTAQGDRIKVEQRPFMAPAHEKVINEKLPRLLKDCVK